MSDILNTEERNESETKRINILETKVNISDKNKEFYDIHDDQILEDDEVIDNSIISERMLSSHKIDNVEKDNIIEEPVFTNRQNDKNQDNEIDIDEKTNEILNYENKYGEQEIKGQFTYDEVKEELEKQIENNEKSKSGKTIEQIVEEVQENMDYDAQMLDRNKKR